MDKETKMMFNSVLEEMAKMEERMNACKLERESVGLLIKKIDQSEARIEELEKKIA